MRPSNRPPVPWPGAPRRLSPRTRNARGSRASPHRDHRRRPVPCVRAGHGGASAAAARRSRLPRWRVSLIGPYTVGYVANAAIATELAEIGVILLMFGVGIHFSIRDLLAVRAGGRPGRPRPDPGRDHRRAPRSGIAPGLGARRWRGARSVDLGGQHGRPAAGAHRARRAGLRPGPRRRRLAHRRGPVHGRGAGAAAEHRAAARRHRYRTASLVRARSGTWPWRSLARRGLRGHHAGRWARASCRASSTSLRANARGSCSCWRSWRSPWASRTLGYQVFGVSLALGGFLAGAVVSESDLSHQAAADAQPLRDTFSVLFFVSVGMLVDPAWIIANPAAGAAGHGGRHRRQVRSRPTASWSSWDIPSASA